MELSLNKCKTFKHLGQEKFRNESKSKDGSPAITLVMDKGYLNDSLGALIQSGARLRPLFSFYLPLGPWSTRKDNSTVIGVYTQEDHLGGLFDF